MTAQDTAVADVTHGLCVECGKPFRQGVFLCALCDECQPDLAFPRVTFRAKEEGYDDINMPLDFEREVLFDGEPIGRIRYSSNPAGWYPLHGVAGLMVGDALWSKRDLHIAARDIEIAVVYGVDRCGVPLHPEAQASGEYDPTWQRGWVE